jgi:hypothetical protein
MSKITIAQLIKRIKTLKRRINQLEKERSFHGPAVGSNGFDGIETAKSAETDRFCRFGKPAKPIQKPVLIKIRNEQNRSKSRVEP